MAEEPDADTLVLRLAIQGGGCSGFQYGLGFDSGSAEGDIELELEGVRVVVDPFSAPYLRGATVDFLNTIEESGFKIENPNAAASCGCGHSFTVAEDADPGVDAGPRLRLWLLSLSATAPGSRFPPMAEAPVRVAVIGSGPAAFYAAGHLLDAERPIEVDMIERLPDALGPRPARRRARPSEAEGGLARVRADRARPGYRFLGNVEVGKDRHARRARCARTTPSSTRSARRRTAGSGFPARTSRARGRPRSSSPGTTATPTSRSLQFDLSVERAVVVGNGNVALDVARMLALTREELAPTDTTDAAIEAIVASGIREIVVLGRRGPVQASWTPAELAELGELAGADVLVDPAELELDPASEAELEAATPIVKRNMDVLREFAAREPTGKPRVDPPPLPRLARRDPRRGAGRGRGDRAQPPRAGRQGQRPSGRDGRARGDSGRDSSFAASATTASRCRARRSTSARARCRTTVAASSTTTGAPVPGSLLRGLDQARPDRDHRDEQEGRDRDGRPAARGSRARALVPRAIATAISTTLLAERGVDVVSYEGWEAIDEVERARGADKGRPRVKLTSWNELIEAARRELIEASRARG